ncbi:hypothetical protein ABT336_20025 [Micromonospora sp. NPDC000207]|uniref:hypothetical protein n=1 Tax=Micromonospora sp. NPDC000207 TaxID=3154246 RepID=UPI0033201DB5
MTTRWAELLPADIQVVVAVPDSLLGPVVARVVDASTVAYVQVVHESQAVAVAAGMGLAGQQALICMENSGLRAAAETIARLTVLHQIPVLALTAHRGEFGDPNWWAQDHSHHMSGLAALFGLPTRAASSTAELTEALRAGIALTGTRMRSALVVATAGLLKELHRELH